MREAAVPLLEAAGVDLVLCGHSHAYERSALAQGMVGDSGTFDAATMWCVCACACTSLCGRPPRMLPSQAAVCISPSQAPASFHRQRPFTGQPPSAGPTHARRHMRRAPLPVSSRVRPFGTSRAIPCESGFPFLGRGPFSIPELSFGTCELGETFSILRAR